MTDTRISQILRRALPQRRNRTDEILAGIAADIADTGPRRARAPESFAERAAREAIYMDDLQAQHDQMADRLRIALAENAVLRAKVEDYADHVDELNAYWEGQCEKAHERTRIITRAYAALESRFKGAMDYLGNALQQSRVEAFAPRSEDRDMREPTEETTDQAAAETEDEAAADVPIFLQNSAAHLPRNHLTN